MVTIGAPAATTSPARASRYCTRPFRGESNVRSVMIDWMRSTSASEFLIADLAWSRCAVAAATRRSRRRDFAFVDQKLLGDEPGLDQSCPRAKSVLEKSNWLWREVISASAAVSALFAF